MVLVLGAPGSGRSTLFKLLAGMKPSNSILEGQVCKNIFKFIQFVYRTFFYNKFNIGII